MKISELRRILDELALKPDADGAAQLSALLQPLNDASLAELSKLIAPGVAKRIKDDARALQAKLTAEKKLQTAAAEAEAVVIRYLTELNATKLDNKAFESVVKRIELDRAINPAQAQEIARRFIGSMAGPPKGKKGVLKAILQRQISDQRAAARASQISEIF